MLPLLVGLTGFAVIAGVMLWGAYFIQGDLNRSAFYFGLSCLPMAATGALACAIATPFITAKRAQVVFVCGGVVTVGAALLAFIAESRSSLLFAVSALAFVGLTYGLINAAVSAALIDTFTPKHSGDGAAMASLAKQFGQLVGVALVGSWRDMSGGTGGSEGWLFVSLGVLGAILLVSAGSFIWITPKPGHIVATVIPPQKR